MTEPGKNNTDNTENIDGPVYGPEWPQFFWANGVRYVNENYEIDSLENYKDDDVQRAFGGLTGVDLALAPPEKKMEIAQKILDQAKNAKLSTFKNDEADIMVKRIMHSQLYKPASLGETIFCDFCRKTIKSSADHFTRKHPYIFARGCVYCSHPLRDGDFIMYWDHITKAHPETVVKKD